VEKPRKIQHKKGAKQGPQADSSLRLTQEQVGDGFSPTNIIFKQF